MTESLVALAALLAVVPALMGSTAACALLVSYAYALALEHLGVAFWWPEWIVPDLFVLKAIAAHGMTLSDELIVALMIPAWVAYFAGETMRYEFVCGLVAMQFVLASALPSKANRHA